MKVDNFNWKYLILIIIIFVVCGKDIIYYFNGFGGDDWKIGRAKVNITNFIQQRSQEKLQNFALDLVNRDRQINNLPILMESKLLSQAAEIHAKDMAKNNYFGYITPEKKSLSEVYPVLKDVHIASSSIFLISGDTSSLTYRSVELGQRGLMYSKDNRITILNPEYKEFGYGIAIDPILRKTYIVQTFR
jgi:uncharacterized protein YkwD